MKTVFNYANFLSESEKKMWRIILYYVERSFSGEERVRDILKSLLALEREFLEEKTTTTDVFAPWLIKLPYNKLKRFGSPDDIESPVGFLRLSMPFPQQDPDYLHIYAPCILSVMERYKYAPELMAAYSWNVNPEMDIKELYAVAKKKAGKDVREIFRKTINEVKAKFAPFYSLSSAQHFYEEGRRFYFHPAADAIYVSSVSPGIMIPEEYYGKEIYFPGISRVIPPGSLSTPSGMWFENWRFRMLEVLFSGKRIENPFRMVYFDDGVQRAAMNIRYGIFWREALATLRKNINYWTERGLGDEYIEDVIAVTRFFLANPKMKMVKLFHEPKSSSLYVYTLLSKGYIFVSEREEKARIRCGRVFNIPVLRKYLTGAVSFGLPLLTSFTEIIEIIEGLTAGTLAGLPIRSLVARKMRSVEKEFSQGIDLKEYIIQNYGSLQENSLRRWIENEINVA